MLSGYKDTGEFAVPRQLPALVVSCRGKAISITYSVAVFVALVIQHAKRMRRIELSSVAFPGVRHFSTSHKRHDFRGEGGGTEHKMCVLIFSTTFG